MKIEELSYPAAGEFLRRYADGTESLPFEEYFTKVSVRFHQEAGKEIATMGNIALDFNQEEGRIKVSDISQANAFAREMGFQKGDLILRLQGQDLQPQTAQQILESFRLNTNAGETVEIIVNRRNEAGQYEEVQLSAPYQRRSFKGYRKLKPAPFPDKLKQNTSRCLMGPGFFIHSLSLLKSHTRQSNQFTNSELQHFLF